MLTSSIFLIFLSLCVGTGVWLFFIWAVRKGEFDDTERAKYRMLDDDDLIDQQRQTDTEDADAPQENDRD